MAVLLKYLKTKTSQLLVRYQETTEYQKNWQDLRNLDLEVCCANIQPKLKNLRSSTVIFYAF